MTKKKKKKESWKERRQRATLKHQKTLEAERLKREGGPKKSGRWSKGKILGVAFMFLLIIGIYGGWQYTQSTNVEEPARGGEAPLFTLTNIDGNVVALGNLTGKVVILHFFFPQDEHSGNQVWHLEKIYRKYDRHEVEIMSISIRESTIEELQEFRTGPNNFSETVYEMSWTITRDTEAENVIGRYHIENFPTMVIIDKEGYVSRRSPFVGLTRASTLSQETDYLLRH